MQTRQYATELARLAMANKSVGREDHLTIYKVFVQIVCDLKSSKQTTRPLTLLLSGCPLNEGDMNSARGHHQSARACTKSGSVPEHKTIFCLVDW